MFLLDTDFIIALHFPGESTHKQALKIYARHAMGQKKAILEPVMFEVATVISRKYSQSEAIKLIKLLQKGDITLLSLGVEELSQVWKMFFSQKNKNISVVDCANLVMSKNLNLRLLSFDKFYPSSTVQTTL